MFIILTAAQADKVRGITSEGHALEPVPLKDGTFMLPPEVLDDPAHAAFADMLKALPQRTVDQATVEKDPAVVKQFSYFNVSKLQRDTQAAFSSSEAVLTDG